VPALMYHDIVPPGAEDSSGFHGVDAALYKVTPDLFEAHLGAITGRLASSARTIQSPPGLPALLDPLDPPAPVLTFDDGGVSAVMAAELLERHGLRGYFFVTVNCIGTSGFVTERDLRVLRSRGHTVGSHSCSHPLRMGHCSWKHLIEEWTRSRAVLGDALGAEVAAASVPGGDFAPIVAEAAAAAGFRYLFTSEPTVRPRTLFGLTIQGRFTIQRWTSAETAAALAAGAWLPWARQAVEWNAKKLGKRLGGERYLQLRKLVLGHGDEVRWGDQP
jgi:peptidoglycan/xylan/chitin deacetylase (PgdA/CDA1 family)